ncbi:MAG: hypothetical protein IJ529_03015 [Alphaproteobacteria bacterium]|nr:hypothetical protein [Alphaproteobacteria bacterium]
MPTFHSWFASKQRCFWLVKLTYEDADTQVLVRSTWIAGILLFAIGAILVSINNSGKVAWVLCEIAYLVVYAWLLLKAILLISIIGLSLWNWAVHGKFLFNKK